MLNVGVEEVIDVTYPLSVNFHTNGKLLKLFNDEVLDELVQACIFNLIDSLKY